MGARLGCLPAPVAGFLVALLVPGGAFGGSWGRPVHVWFVASRTRRELVRGVAPSWGLGGVGRINPELRHQSLHLGARLFDVSICLFVVCLSLGDEAWLSLFFVPAVYMGPWLRGFEQTQNCIYLFHLSFA